jgi:hypothetical protein
MVKSKRLGSIFSGAGVGMVGNRRITGMDKYGVPAGNKPSAIIFNPDNLTTETIDPKGFERITCPECPSVYYMLIGTNADGEELYRCHKCKCEWKHPGNKDPHRIITKHGIRQERTLNEETG